MVKSQQPMFRRRIREQLLIDRRRLLAALRDCELGRTNAEVDVDPVNLMRALQRRIADIDDQLKQIDAERPDPRQDAP